MWLVGDMRECLLLLLCVTALTMSKVPPDMFEVMNDVEDGSFSCNVCYRTAADRETRHCSFVLGDELEPLHLNFQLLSAIDPIDFVCSRKPVDAHPNPNADTDVSEIREGSVDVGKYMYRVEGSREISLAEHVVSQRLGLTLRDSHVKPPDTPPPGAPISPRPGSAGPTGPGEGFDATPEQVRVLNALNHHMPRARVQEMAREAAEQREAARLKMQRKKDWKATQHHRKQRPDPEL